MEMNVSQKFQTYPVDAKIILVAIRERIFAIGKELSLTDLQETLKWNEPSYITKNGSTVRLDWKEKFPEQVSIYFNCKTSLIKTFKEIYFDRLKFEGNRAIVLPLSEPVPWPEIEHCISLSLQYHKLKNLPLLGA